MALNADTVVPFDQVIGVLWDDPPDSARQQVYNVVNGLRRTLAAADGVARLDTDPVGYRLSVPWQAVDVLRFRADVRDAERAAADGAWGQAARSLERGLDRWRGPAFGGLAGIRWQGTATLVDDQRIAAAERLAEIVVRHGGDVVGLLGRLSPLVQENPLRESLRATLMNVLVALGRPAEAITVFEEGRKALAEELGVDPGPRLQAAHRQALTGAAEPDRDGAPITNTDVAADAKPPDGPHFLPRDVMGFTGRRAEVDRLIAHAAQAETTAVAIAAINGMGGVGKTALAVHAGHRLAERYPDGQYFIDLQSCGAAGEPLTPVQALGLLLRDAGVAPEAVPPDLAGRAALWRSRLAGKRILLVLDNALDAAQVRPLLPGAPGALALITSRRRLTSLEGAVSLPLNVMTEAEGVALFRQVAVPARPDWGEDAVATTVALCGQLPLAIQVAAARLRDRPNWSIAYLVEQLGDDRSRARVLAADDRDVLDILASSMRHLAERERTVVRLLGVHRGPDIDAYATAALTGLTRYQAEACLEELFEVSLLEQPAPGRYRLHDLVRDSSRPAPEAAADREEATDRLLDYYLRAATAWCEPISRPAPGCDAPVEHEPLSFPAAATRQEAIGHIEAEFGNLAAAVRLAAEAGRHDRAWRLACTLLPYLRLLEFGGESEALLELALAAACVAGSSAGRSTALMGLAQLRRTRGLLGEAYAAATQAIELSRQTGDRAREASQLTVLGTMYVDDDRYLEALTCFTEARKLFSATADHAELANLTYYLGIVHRELGDLDAARRHVKRPGPRRGCEPASCQSSD